MVPPDPPRSTNSHFLPSHSPPPPQVNLAIALTDLGTRIKLLGQAADSIALLVKSYRTNQVYNTNGGVTEDETLVSTGPHWIVSKEYERQLKGIAKRFHCEYETCVMVDQSFRVKRARGKVNVNGRYVVWYERTSDYGIPGDLMGSWFDITLTNEAPDIKLWEVHDEKMARTAHNIHVQQELAESGSGRMVRTCAKCNIVDSKTYFS